MCVIPFVMPRKCILNSLTQSTFTYNIHTCFSSVMDLFKAPWLDTSSSLVNRVTRLGKFSPIGWLFVCPYAYKRKTDWTFSQAMAIKGFFLSSKSVAELQLSFLPAILLLQTLHNTSFWCHDKNNIFVLIRRSGHFSVSRFFIMNLQSKNTNTDYCYQLCAYVPARGAAPASQKSI
jgi:hypothetical protein